MRDQLVTTEVLVGVLLLTLSSWPSLFAEDPGAEGPKATLVIRNIEPRSGSLINKRTVIVAQLDWRIPDFNTSRDQYILAPMFQKTDESTFNAVRGFSDGKRIIGPTGSTTMSYRNLGADPV